VAEYRGEHVCLCICQCPTMQRQHRIGVKSDIYDCLWLSLRNSARSLAGASLLAKSRTGGGWKCRRCGAGSARHGGAASVVMRGRTGCRRRLQAAHDQYSPRRRSALRLAVARAGYGRRPKQTGYSQRCWDEHRVVYTTRRRLGVDGGAVFRYT